MSQTFEPVKPNVRIMLSALWVCVMFLYIYVDHFALFIPGVIEGAIAGEMGFMQVNQVSLLAAMALMTVPILMIVLTFLLRPSASPWVNLIVGILYVIVVVANTIGETWAYYIFGSVVEGVLLILIVVKAWTWPRS